MKKSSILVTGVSGFIGAALTKKLLERGENVIGIDNMNSYYEKSLKYSRLNQIIELTKEKNYNFEFIENSIENINCFEKYLRDKNIEIIFHLAAQAGVRYSLENPNAYIQSNLVGFFNIIEQSKSNKVDHFYYASSSSVYGGNKKIPFEEKDFVDKPISLYAATKKSNELIAHTYSHLFSLPTTGLRFFTVYGPWGRPDMAYYKFTDAIIKNKPIRVFNYGNMLRDFTYIDDVIDSVFYLIKRQNRDKNFYINNESKKINNSDNYKVFNIGNSKPIKLIDYIKAIEYNLDKKAEMILEEIPLGDVKSTYANTDLLENYINFKPNTSIDKGIKEFIAWYLDYNKI